VVAEAGDAPCKADSITMMTAKAANFVGRFDARRQTASPGWNRKRSHLSAMARQFAAADGVLPAIAWTLRVLGICIKKRQQRWIRHSNNLFRNKTKRKIAVAMDPSPRAIDLTRPERSRDVGGAKRLLCV